MRSFAHVASASGGGLDQDLDVAGVGADQVVHPQLQQVVKVDDAKTLRKTLNGLLEKLIEKAEGKVRIKTTQSAGREVSYLEAPEMEPGFERAAAL